MARSSSSPAPPVVTPVSRQARHREQPFALNLLISLRPVQWTKNCWSFAGLLFGLRLFSVAAIGRSAAAFAIFCLLSGVVYLINDVADREQRSSASVQGAAPIASGALSVPAALVSALIISAGELSGAFALGLPFVAIAAAYLLLLGLYSGLLKHIVIIDVLTLSRGICPAAVARRNRIDVEISHVLLVCTILLALFIALAKRRHELILLAKRCGRSPADPWGVQSVSARSDDFRGDRFGAHLVHLLHHQSGNGVEFGTRWLGLTIPFPLYGIFDTSIWCINAEGGGSPARSAAR